MYSPEVQSDITKHLERYGQVKQDCLNTLKQGFGIVCNRLSSVRGHYTFK